MFDVAQYEKANIALGSHGSAGSRKEVGWLLTFATKDLTLLDDEAKREDYRYRLLALTWRGRLWINKGQASDIEEQQGWTDFGEDAPLPTWSKVLEVQAETRNLVSELIELHSVTLSLEPIRLEISTAYTSRRQDAILIVETDSPLTLFRLRVATLLHIHGGYIWECGKCTQWFLASRKDQVFCSPKCMNREMQRRDRERKKKKKEETEQQRRDRAMTRKEQAPRRPRTLKPTQQRTKGGKAYGTKR